MSDATRCLRAYGGAMTRGSPALRRSGAERWSPVLVAVLALALAGWAAAGGTGLGAGRRSRLAGEPATVVPSAGGATEPPPSTPPTFAGPDPDGAIPAWLFTAGAFLFIAAVAGLLLYIGLRYLLIERVARREILDQPATQPPGADLEQVRDAVRAGLADLDTGGDPRRAVIACWLRLERLAAAAGSARLAADTPADLVTRLLARHRVSDRALDRLADAYRLARYAPAEVSGELLATARQALQDVAVHLGARVPEPRP
jgi:hypothetical protein